MTEANPALAIIIAITIAVAAGFVGTLVSAIALIKGDRRDLAEAVLALGFTVAVVFGLIAYAIATGA